MVLQIQLELEPLYSTLATDPVLAEVVEQFVDQLPDRIAKLVDCVDGSDWESLGRLAHQLKGAVGSYGFGSITPFAHRLELAVKVNESEDIVRRATADLIDLCRRVRKGTGPQSNLVPDSATAP